jgi:hypothetical protein
MKPRWARGRQNVDCWAETTYLFAFVRPGRAAADAWAIILLGQTPLDCEANQFGQAMFSEDQVLTSLLLGNWRNVKTSCSGGWHGLRDGGGSLTGHQGGEERGDGDEETRPHLDG